MVTEGELPYWHLEHEVLLAEAKANISNSAVEEAGGSENQNQVEVSGKGSLEVIENKITVIVTMQHTEEISV